MTNVPETVQRQAAGGAPKSAAKATPSESTTKTGGPMKRFGKPLIWVVIVLALAAGGYYAWLKLRPSGLPVGLASGNGRIEATEIDVDAKIPGRIADILVAEGDFVSAGQALAHMDTRTLEAQRREAEAQLDRATIGVEAAEAVVRQREAERTAATAQIAAREALLDAASARLARVEPMAAKDFETKQALDDARAAKNAAAAAVAEGQANLAAAEAGISAANAQVIDAKAAVVAAKATIERIVADIDDSSLKTPRDGRVQFKVAEQGEVLPAGGRVLNLVDLSDVYITLLPADQGGWAGDHGRRSENRPGPLAGRRHSRVDHLRRQCRAIHPEDCGDRGGAAEADVSGEGANPASFAAQIYPDRQDRRAGRGLCQAGSQGSVARQPVGQVARAQAG